ncbi:uncharacterized protein LOC110675173 [Aedes aegypti]|uniref:Uncharacterized protein n=1 Tax=Aedes aegypti TaxID=7159 RepID=A0A6I8U698_AEDAE|nr:uncharacterized protein LOC110675173 [Aedes aegypti]
MEDNPSRAPLPPRPLPAAIGNFDNGAVGTKPESTSSRKTKTKVSKKMLLAELSALKQELATIRSEKEPSFRDFDASATHNDSVDCGLSEVTQQPSMSGNGSLLATMSNMSLGSLNIPECKPTEGETDLGVGQKRPHNESGEGEPMQKIAAITQNGEEKEAEVMDNDDIE